VPTNEGGLVAAIQREIAKRWPSAWQFKVVGSPYQMAGVPDLLLCVEGLTVGLEVKFQRPGESAEHAVGRTTQQQLVQIERINRSGGAAATVISVDEAVAVIKAGLTRERNGASDN
jgi:hypothetical protein